MRRQELVCAADSEVEAVIAYRNALENALLQPAAAHPVEGFGAANLSLAQVSPCDEGLQLVSPALLYMHRITVLHA